MKIASQKLQLNFSIWDVSFLLWRCHLNRERYKDKCINKVHLITVRKDPLNDPDALMFLKNVLKFGLKNSEE